MRWKTRKKQSESLKLLIIPKYLYPGTVLTSRNLFRQLPGNSIGLTERKGTDECKVRKVWVILECQYITEDSEVGVYLPAVQKERQVPGPFFKKAILVVLKLALSALLTFPYAVWSIEYAFLQRGYKAYGGEYLFIPFVFYVTFLILGGFIKLANRGG